MISASTAPTSSKVTSRVLADLIAIVGADNVLHNRDETLVYECDGYMVERSLPDVVVFPDIDAAGRRNRQALQPP